MVDRIDPKMGINESSVATTAKINEYLTEKMSRPTYVNAPLSRQMITWPRMTPDSDRLMPAAMTS